MSTVQKKIGFKPIDADARKSIPSHHEKFGSIHPTGLPVEGLKRIRMAVTDQGVTDFCTAFGEAVDQGYQYGIAMSPEGQTALESEYIGAPIIDGADPIPSMEATSLDGSIPEVSSPFSLSTKTPDFIADWTNWPVSILSIGKGFLGGVPYEIDGPYDIFDNVRQALNQSWESGEKSCAKAFGFWYESWNNQAMDTIQKGRVQCPVNEQPISNHRYNFIDWIPSGNDFLLVAALTQGKEYGDSGFLYFDRVTVNTVFANAARDGLGLFIARPRTGMSFLNWLQQILNFLSERVNSLLSNSKSIWHQ